MEKDSIDLRTISQRAVKGALSLTFRRVALQAISFITINLILARILPVATLGVFNIGTAVISFFSFFSDIGLAAAIIQKKGEVSREELKTTFSIQQALALLITLLMWVLAPMFVDWYNLEESSVWLFRALGVAFFLTSLKVIPSVLLERELNFAPLVGVEIVETLVFNVSLIILTLMKFDIMAFSISAVLRSAVGSASIYLIAPWKIGIGFSRQSARVLLNFGIPYQLNSLLALLKDRLVPLLIARIIGSAGIGYVTWAQNLAFLPLEVMNIIIRVSFPTLARLQNEDQVLRQALERSLFVTALFLYPMLFGMLALAPSLVAHVVSNKWLPALPAFYLFSISSFWATISTTFTNALNAIGEIKTTLKLMVMWTILTWVLTPILTINFGFMGVSLASAIISFSSVLTIILIKRFIKVEIVKNIWQPILASAVMGAVVFYLAQLWVTSLITLVLMVAMGGVLYLGLIVLLAKDKIKDNLSGVKNAFTS